MRTLTAKSGLLNVQRVIGVYSFGIAGLEIYGYEYGPNDRIIYGYRYNDRPPKEQRARIRYTARGRAYFLFYGRRVHLDECMSV